MFLSYLNWQPDNPSFCFVCVIVNLDWQLSRVQNHQGNKSLAMTERSIRLNEVWRPILRVYSPILWTRVHNWKERYHEFNTSIHHFLLPDWGYNVTRLFPALATKTSFESKDSTTSLSCCCRIVYHNEKSNYYSLLSFFLLYLNPRVPRLPFHHKS